MNYHKPKLCPTKLTAICTKKCRKMRSVLELLSQVA